MRFALLCALASGLLHAHAITTTGHLAWLAPIPWGLALILATKTGVPLSSALKRGALLGAIVGTVASAHLWGFAYYAPGVYAFVVFFHALLWGAFSLVSAFLLRRAGALAPMAIGASWALFENGRSLGSFSFPFFLGGMLAEELAVAQITSVIGASGLSGLLFFFGFGIAGPLSSRLCKEPRFRQLRFWLPSSIVVVLAIGGGWLRLENARPAARVIEVSALQGSMPSWFYGLAGGTGPFRRVIEEHYGFLYRRAMAGRPQPDLVLFPETTFDWHLPRTTEGIRRIAPFSAVPLPSTTSLLFGASFRADNGGSINGVAIANAGEDGLPELETLIAKRRLVPFIEVGHRPGDDFGLAEVGNQKVGIAVCYESMYSQSAHDVARRGAHLLAILSDDAGMRHSPLARTHAIQGRIRAIEAGLPLVRAGQAGPSFAVDAYGRLLSELGHWETGVLKASLPLHDLPTLYRRIGMHWNWLWGGIVLWAIFRPKAWLA